MLKWILKKRESAQTTPAHPLQEEEGFVNILEKPKARVAVVGAGVIGLTTAILAQDAGFKVIIYTDQSPFETTTTRAAASFVPFAVPLTPKVLQMVHDSWKWYADLESAVGTSTTGVRKHTHWEVTTHYQDPKSMPYLEFMDNVTEIHGKPAKIPGNYNHAIRYTTYFIEIPIYVSYLVERFKQGGGLIITKHFDDMHELALLDVDVAFNCTGLGARQLANDDNVIPLRGQVAFIGPEPAMLQKNESVNHDHTLYVYPQPVTNRTIIGGTLVEDWDDRVDPAVTQLIVRANTRVLPHITERDIQGAVVGLRPYRKVDVRVEAETVDGKLIVHNYGHGGAGVTLSWGSGQLAMERLKQ